MPRDIARSSSDSALLPSPRKALQIERQMHGFVKQKYAGLVDKIEATKDLDADAEQALSKAIEEFKATLA